MPHKPTIPTDAPEDGKTRKCSQCGEWKPLTRFSCLPLDKRCDTCLPPSDPVAMQLWDKRLDLAQRKVAQIFDASEKAGELEPLERQVKSIYDAWGGPDAFSQDVVEWIKRMADQGAYAKAVNAAINVMKIHGRIDKMKQEDDWKAMDDENVKAALKLKLANLVAESMLEEEGQGILNMLVKNEDAKEGDNGEVQ